MSQHNAAAGSAASNDTTAIDYDALGRTATIATPEPDHPPQVHRRWPHRPGGDPERRGPQQRAGPQREPRGSHRRERDRDQRPLRRAGPADRVWLDGRDPAATHDLQHRYRVGD